MENRRERSIFAIKAELHRIAEADPGFERSAVDSVVGSVAKVFSLNDEGKLCGRNERGCRLIQRNGKDDVTLRDWLLEKKAFPVAHELGNNEKASHRPRKRIRF